MSATTKKRSRSARRASRPARPPGPDPVLVERVATLERDCETLQRHIDGLRDRVSRLEAARDSQPAVAEELASEQSIDPPGPVFGA
jgi:hypothetical protein